ncbi:hypothetical protein KJ567_02635 [Candidatus Bipolaricaulota bacterium]|nr:hypothetical protein [Candidatus Bipolaricaulota bacterium]
MASRLLTSRWRHLLIMLPLGAAIGLVIGLIFRDLLFGVGVGAALGCAFGLLLAVRKPSWS